MMGTGIAQVLQDYLPPGSSVDVIPGPGAIGNMGLLAKNEGGFGNNFRYIRLLCLQRITSI